MSKRQKMTLGEVIEFIDGDRGRNYPSQGEFFQTGHCLFLSTRNVPNSRFSFEENLFINEEKDLVLRKGKLRRGDYVLTTRGTVGNFAYYDEAVPYENLRINSGMVILRKKSDKLEQEYLRYFLASPSFNEQVKSRVSGSAQPQLPIRDMLSMEIDLPDVKIQSRIASVLSAYDDLIENNEKRVRILEEMAQRLYTEWFVKFEFPGHEKVRLVDSGTGFGKIPEGWEVGRLSDVFENLRIATQAGSHLASRRYVPIDCIPRKSLALKESNDWIEAQSSLILFEKGDVLFGAMRPYFHKVAIAPYPGITRTTCFVLRPKFEYFRSFGTLLVFSDAVVAYASGHAKGSTIPYAVWENSLSEYKVNIPNVELLKIFEEIVANSLNELVELAQFNNVLIKMRNSLIPQLVTGRRELKNYVKH